MIDSEIVRWATAIPDNLPLNLSALSFMLPGSADKVPPTTEYATMAFLAIFEVPERRLTDEEIFEALEASFAWFRRHSEDSSWKVRIEAVYVATDPSDLPSCQRDVIKCMLSDTRFKASHEGGRHWTIDIPEVHRHPFVHRDARDRPMRLLPPSPKAPTEGYHNSVSRFGADYVEMGGRSRAATPGCDGTHPRLQRPNHSTSAGDSSSGSSHNRASRRTFSPVRHPHPPRRNSISSWPLPPYSEVLPTRESSGEREHHVHAGSVVSDNLVLPSIRDVLGTEMHLVEERGRTTGC